MRIYKTLPTGKRKYLDVTPEEYYNRGWATNGWVNDTAEGISFIDQALQLDAFKKKFDSIPTEELAKYPMTIHIFKDTPQGRKRKTITYGEYFDSNLPAEGWIIDATDGKFKLPRINATTRKATESQLRKQSWWWPRRSYDQARAMHKWAFTDDSYTDEQKAQQIELLRDMKYVPNPKMKRYLDRLTSYAGKKTNQMRKLKTMPKWAQQSWWRQQRQLMEVENGIIPPDPVITKLREMADSRPRPSRARGGKVDAFKLMNYHRHYDIYSFPWKWRQWRGY